MVCTICRTRNADNIRYGNMPMCDECWNNEQAMTAENMTPENQQARVDAANAVMARNRTLVEAEKIDASIQIRSDIFNAKTTAILDLKAAIDGDANIINKPYALAEALKTRFTHLSEVIFERDQKTMDDRNEQRAIQSYLNTMANQLRSEEREKLRLQDMSYTVQAVKPVVKKITTTKQSKAPAHRQRFDKEALAKYSKELGVPEFHLQQIAIQRGCDIEKAAEILRDMLAKMKAAIPQS